MRTHKTLDISFVKVKDIIYNANVDNTELNNFIKDIVESFTHYKIDKFSMLMDISISEEILSRTIADAFIKEYENIIKDSTTGIIVNCSMNEINYKVSIAYNEEKLGGFIYGILS